MSNFKNDPGFGQLWQNTFKDPNNPDHEKKPDASGTFVDPDGNEWQIAGWRKKSSGGKNFYSLKITRPPEKEHLEAKPEDFDDDVPF